LISPGGSLILLGRSLGGSPKIARRIADLAEKIAGRIAGIS